MPTIVRTSVTESDDYSRSVAGIDIEVIRTGAGSTPTRIQSARTHQWAGSSLTIGFPVFSRTELSADHIGVAVIEQARPGMRWCGIDLSSGDVLAYAPEAKHLAVHPDGARFCFAVFPVDTLHRIAADADSAIDVAQGSVNRVASTDAARSVRSLLPSHVGPRRGACAPNPHRSGLAETVAYMLASGSNDTSLRSRKLDNRVIVQTSIDYAERIERIPTIGELCRASHVSERRLNAAFVETHDVPPRQFFMTWALDLARRRLIGADPQRITVSWIAMGSGFTHLGRFARYYREMYDELPSETLQRLEPVN